MLGSFRSCSGVVYACASKAGDAATSGPASAHSLSGKGQSNVSPTNAAVLQWCK